MRISIPLGFGWRFGIMWALVSRKEIESRVGKFSSAGVFAQTAAGVKLPPRPNCTPSEVEVKK